MGGYLFFAAYIAVFRKIFFIKNELMEVGRLTRKVNANSWGDEGGANEQIEAMRCSPDSLLSCYVTEASRRVS